MFHYYESKFALKRASTAAVTQPTQIPPNTVEQGRRKHVTNVCVLYSLAPTFFWDRLGEILFAVTSEMFISGTETFLIKFLGTNFT